MIYLQFIYLYAMVNFDVD